MPTQDLNIHDIQIADQTAFGAGGQAAQRRRVTFFVGSHGPFTLDYAKSEATPDRIKQDIRQQASDLAGIHDLLS